MSATYGQKLHATSAGGHLYTEMKPEHATDCSLRRDQKGRKNQANPLSGGGCLLTKGVLIRVRLVTEQLRISCFEPPPADGLYTVPAVGCSMQSASLDHGRIVARYAFRLSKHNACDHAF